MKFWKNQKTLLAAFLALAWPTVLEQFLGTIVQYVDTAMVGHLGAEATATVSLSSTYNWLFGSVMSALGIGFLSYIARAIGEKNEYKIRHAAGQAVWVALVLGAALTIITQTIAPYMPIWMGAEESIRAGGALYFRLINLPILLRTCMVVFAAVLRSTGDTRSPMKINVFVNAANTGLNYVFIYALGFGAVGAGIATAISFSAGGILMVRAFVKNETIGIRREHLRPEKEILLGCLSIGIPIMLTQIVSGLGYIVATSFVSSMVTAVFAAHSIAITAEQIFYIPGYGMQAATSTLIGNALGEGNRKKEHSIMILSLSLIFGIMCVTGLLLFVGARFMMGLFTTDPEVITLGARLLRIVAFTEPIFGAAAVMDGIYAGLGRTRIPLVVEIIGRWGVRIFGAFLCINIFGKGIVEFWYCMIGDNICRAVLLGIGIVLIVRGERRNAQEIIKNQK